MSPAAAHRTVRALFRGPLPQTAQALLAGEVSAAHAQAVAEGTHHRSNPAMVCRAHHRRVHEEGWRLIRGPDGRFTVTPTHPGHHAIA
jgi:hypothetical protein